MKIYELVEYISGHDFEDDAEVYVEIDGALYECDVDLVEESFDGFDTAYPESIKLTPRVG